MIAGQKLSKTAGFQAMATFVVNIRNTRSCTAAVAKSRYSSYRKRYKNAKKISQPGATGHGITDIDRKKNITTIEQKLESMCPFFERMDRVLGNRQNVTPSAIAEIVGVSKDFFNDISHRHYNNSFTMIQVLTFGFLLPKF
uniref:Uncharacterized protein n=1 Tax=Spongospora subterranea TaxID=70186 RepID=A0A0H5RE86_9EUKA|eukprot:CRZ12076.1 hypothetical protein [Spongospora subterranea]